jgi:hypothetical protein
MLKQNLDDIFKNVVKEAQNEKNANKIVCQYDISNESSEWDQIKFNKLVQNAVHWCLVNGKQLCYLFFEEIKVQKKVIVKRICVCAEKHRLSRFIDCYLFAIYSLSDTIQAKVLCTSFRFTTKYKSTCL